MMHFHVKWQDSDGQPFSARVSVTDEAGRFHAPAGAWIHADDGYDRSERPFEAHYFHTRGEEDFELPAGKFEVEILKGFEEPLQRQTLNVEEGQEYRRNITESGIRRWTGFADENWVSSDLHVHMNYGGTYRNTPEHLVEQAEAENLGLVDNLIVNKEQRFPDIAYDGKQVDLASKADATIVHGQEFHTSYWGHRGLLNLRGSVILPGYAGYPNTAAASLYPMNADVYDMAHEQGALVGAVHPFDEVPDPFAKPAQRITDELPVDVALGKLDYMEIVGFSDHKATAEVWYKLLNLAFRLPAGAGTDATANYAAPIRGTVGQDRVYVWTPGWPANIEMWKDELKKGRPFATNGPLIEFKLGGEMVGSELKFDAAQEAVPFSAKLRSIVPVEHLEIVCNGRVVKELELSGMRDTADVTGAIPLGESGWCVLRAWSDKAEYPVMDKYTYATTSPVYVTIDGKRARSAADAEYFSAWIGRTMEITDSYPDWNSAEEKEKVMKRLREARGVFEGMR